MSLDSLHSPPPHPHPIPELGLLYPCLPDLGRSGICLVLTTAPVVIKVIAPFSSLSVEERLFHSFLLRPRIVHYVMRIEKNKSQVGVRV